jgi:hypothetical protein
LALSKLSATRRIQTSAYVQPSIWCSASSRNWRLLGDAFGKNQAAGNPKAVVERVVVRGKVEVVRDPAFTTIAAAVEL